MVEFETVTGVSRETLGRFCHYAESLRRWQRVINLVGPSTLDDAWRRHFLDSAQLFPYLPSAAARIVDLGSGAGFPGLVLAILGATDVHLIEANRRKAEFLRETARATGTQVTVHPVRAESARPLAADVVVARGCAPLVRLLGLAERHLAGDGFGLFLKGKGVEAELSEAGRRWKMRTQRFPSCTERSSVVLKVEGLAPKEEGR